MSNLTPAAISALFSGDLENVIAASTPGGIEAQEAGQAALVGAADKLPKDLRYSGVTREQVEAAWGIKFGAVVDGIFVRVTLPVGWTIKATDHSMWSDLLDATGARRACIFYKAAFYDRGAHMSIERRYFVHTSYDTEDRRTTVRDSKTGATLFDAGTAEARDYETQDRQGDAAAAWLKDHFPDAKNPLAYWDE